MQNTDVRRRWIDCCRDEKAESKMKIQISIVWIQIKWDFPTRSVSTSGYRSIEALNERNEPNFCKHTIYNWNQYNVGSILMELIPVAIEKDGRVGGDEYAAFLVVVIGLGRVLRCILPHIFVLQFEFNGF